MLKPVQRNRKFMESKVEECHEIKATEQVLEIGRGDKEDVITDLGKYEKMVEELKELEER